MRATASTGRFTSRAGVALVRAAVLACVASAGMAQIASADTKAYGTEFAQPWHVSFAHIRDAQLGKAGAYYVEQTRRELAPASSPSRFQGTLERLTYRPAEPTTQTPERFKLEFLGYEGVTLSSQQFGQELALFAARAGFTFHYKGFHVADADLAAKEYDLLFLARGRRSTQQGVVDIFRLAAIPKRWDRNAWLLELDTRTGFPLYAGEYAVTGNSIDLRSELIVTSYLSNIRVPDASDPSWWRSNRVTEEATSADAALRKALTQSTRFVEPVLTELPAGFQLQSSDVVTDPYKGARSAVLSYSDGIDRLFVAQRNVPVTARGAEDMVYTLDEHGITKCVFTHQGVEFQVVGRSVRDVVRAASVSIYARAITILQ